MDQKQWNWGKKSREKSILETDKTNLTPKENHEVLELLDDREKLEKELKRLNDKLVLALSECNTKDEHMKKQTKIVQEAVSGWEKAEAEMLSMKEHLEESIHQELLYEERVANLDCALKECMQQLNFVRDEQERRIYDALMKASVEFDQSRVFLEKELSETSKRLAKTVIENSYLNKSIIVKDNLIEDMERQLTEAETDRDALMVRLESIEKDNASLKYETRLLQKELDTLNEFQFSRTASKLLQLESEIHSKGQVALEQPRSNLALQELSPASMSEIGNDDNVSYAESSASALISELEHFKSQKPESLSCKSFGPSDINLMGDFIEMEKLAVVSVEKLEDQSTFDSGKDSCRFDAPNAETQSIKRIRTQLQRDLNKSIGKMIELIDGINVPADDNNNHVASSGYMVRLFQWKTSDLNDVLQKFVNACYSLLNGKADHENFGIEVTTALEWIINHCFSIHDVSSMKDEVKKQFDWDEIESESEAKKLQTDTSRFQELEKTIASLRLELKTLEESNKRLEDQIQNERSLNRDHDSQLTETELNEAYHKILELEVELESKNHYCEELDTKFVELQLQLESMKKTHSNDYGNQKNDPLRTEWEITAASEKLAECQETILILEKQLKALAAKKDMSLFDNIIAAHRRPIITNTSSVSLSCKDAKMKNRPSLLDQMLADDDAKTKVCKANEKGFKQPLEKIVVLTGVRGNDDSVNVNSRLAILPAKKSGRRSFWKRMLGTRRKPKRKQVFQFNK
ncbi:filament-like plant protein 7 [Vicia villosa]|uniref:filament-like plant protein 7 n=1 Tax=Vicia villosa TaxID=3911 RepID=UPI00273AA4C4|nr:filament-like plant protein 7 [Vicia villosa]